MALSVLSVNISAHMASTRLLNWEIKGSFVYTASNYPTETQDLDINMSIFQEWHLKQDIQ